MVSGYALDDEVFDYVVVGAGAAGAVLAARLAEDGRASVCVLEAGGDDGAAVVRVPAGFAAAIAGDARTWEFWSEPNSATGDRRIRIPQGKLLGGSGAINGMLYVRGQPADYDEWATAGCQGWSFAEVAPYFNRIDGLDTPEVEDRSSRRVRLPVAEQTWTHPLTAAFVCAATVAGYPANPNYNSRIQEGVGLFRTTTARGLRRSSAQVFLAPARRRANLDLRLNARVHKVLLAEGRAQGVTYTRKGEAGLLSIRARRRVILCAGPINTPKILQLSGLGPAALLSALGIEVARDLPGVGENLVDHYSVRLMYGTAGRASTLNDIMRGPRLAYEVLKWLAGRPSALAAPPSHAYLFARSGAGASRPDLQCVFTPGSYVPGSHYVFDRRPGISAGIWQHRPRSRGHVRAASAAPEAAPIVQPNYLCDEADQRALVGAVKLLRRVLATAPLDRLLDAETFPGPGVISDAEILDFCRSYGSTAFHLVGTARMGDRSDDGAVVDAQLNVRGVAGLTVADASVIPQIPSANTYATTLMIAERAADIVLARRAEGGGGRFRSPAEREGAA